MSIPTKFGTAVIVSSGDQLDYSCTITDGVSNSVISDTIALTAGTYSPDGYLTHVGKVLRTSLFTQISGSSLSTTDPPSEASVIVQIGIPDANVLTSPGATKVELFLGATGATGPGGAITYVSFSPVQGAGSVWHSLGIALPQVGRTFNASGGTITGTGLSQPRWIFVFRASINDFGDEERLPGLFGLPVGDGSTFVHDFGRSARYREITIVDLPQKDTGPARPVAFFNTFTAVRSTFTVDSRDEAVLRGMTGTLKDLSNLSDGDYLRIGDFWARFESEVSSNNLRTYDLWPTGLVLNTSEIVDAISDGQALIKEWIRTQKLFVYERNEGAGTSKWISRCYAPAQNGVYRIEQRRRDNRNGRYSIDLSCVLNTNPGLTVP